MTFNTAAAALEVQGQNNGTQDQGRMTVSLPILQCNRAMFLGRSFVAATLTGAAGMFVGGFPAAAVSFVFSSVTAAWVQWEAYRDIQGQIDEHFAMDAIKTYIILNSRGCLRPRREEYGDDELGYNNAIAAAKLADELYCGLKQLLLPDARRRRAEKQFTIVMDQVRELFVKRISAFKSSFESNATLVLRDILEERVKPYQEQNALYAEVNKKLHEQNQSLQEQLKQLQVIENKSKTKVLRMQEQPNELLPAVTGTDN